MGVATMTKHRAEPEPHHYRRFNMKQAVEYIGDKLHVTLSIRTFRTWLDRGVIPYYRVPGGRFFWSQEQLDFIVELIQKGDHRLSL